tara:strand:- start:59 stop:499 length:441 start_codon:yes stop_codon:yes gene_type:complete
MSISYSAIVIDEMSKATLLGRLSDLIPAGWDIFAHHMTITMGPLVHPKENKRKKGHDYSAFGPPGTPHSLVVTELGIDDRAMAVKVQSPFPTRNDKKGGFAHITIAVNTAAGGKPFHSNKIPLENFDDISQMGIILKGTVEEIPQA